MEIYKDIPGYEGMYQVSNYGNVRSLNYNNTNNEKIMKLVRNTTPYYNVKLSKKCKFKTYQVHKLVAMAFLGHKPNGHNVVINHKDNNQLNNHVDNLELVTQRYNSICHKNDAGITYDKNRFKWQSQIQINNKYVYLGRFTDKEKALQMYQSALANIHLYDGNNKTFRELLKNQNECSLRLVLN